LRSYLTQLARVVGGNNTVAQRIADAGFTEVEVTGDGRERRPRHFGRLTMRLRRSPAKSARSSKSP